MTQATQLNRAPGASGAVGQRPAVKERVRAAAAVIRREADAIEKEGAITQPVFDALRDAGLFSLTIPRAAGGDEADFRTFAETIEELCCADGSAGWVYWVLLGMRSSTWMFGSPAIRAIIFDETQPQMIAGQVGRFPDGVKVANRYRVSGRFSFASGSRHATWICAGATITEDGQPLLDDDGSARTIHFWVPKEQVRFIDNWNVMGLAATESYDYELQDCFVPEAHTVDASALIHNLPSAAADATPFMRLGAMNIGLAGHGAIAAGIARRALEEVARISGSVKRMDYPTVVRDHPAFQAEFSEQEVRFRGARFNYYHVFSEAERTVAEGVPLSEEQRARFRQATTWMHKVAEETVRFAQRWCGTGVIRHPNAMARCVRDIAVATQHIMADPIGMAAAAPPILAAWSADSSV